MHWTLTTRLQGLKPLNPAAYLSHSSGRGASSSRAQAQNSAAAHVTHQAQAKEGPPTAGQAPCQSASHGRRRRSQGVSQVTC